MAKKAKRDRRREQRIATEIVVDAYDDQERAMGWYYYLQERLRFPLRATCLAKRATSPLRVKDEVEVIGIPDESECEHEVFVTIRWGKGRLAVPLVQLQPVSGTDAQTKEAIRDWHYWVQMGYKF